METGNLGNGTDEVEILSLFEVRTVLNCVRCISSQIIGRLSVDSLMGWIDVCIFVLILP